MLSSWQHILNLRNVFLEAVSSVRPEQLLSDLNRYDFKPKPATNAREAAAIRMQNKQFIVNENRCHLVGFGKAVLGMGLKLEKELGRFLGGGALSVPVGAIEQYERRTGEHVADSRLQIYEGALNNLPDEAAELAGRSILNLATSMTHEDVLIVLISGGGSALLPVPRAPFTLKQKQELVQSLQKKGTDIKELNAVRMELSQVKGGRLAAAAQNANAIITLVISDIVGNPLDLIASGPTYRRGSSALRAQTVLQKYGLWQELSLPIQELLAGDSLQLDEYNNANAKNEIFLIGDNSLAASTSLRTAQALNYAAVVLSTEIEGEVQAIVELYIALLRNIINFRAGKLSQDELYRNFPFGQQNCAELVSHLKSTKPVLLILSGEPTVEVAAGNGIGGRNQELALRMALAIYEHEDLQKITFFSAGTDGIDGPTPAAGALGSQDVIAQFLASNPRHTIKDVQACLREHDSYNFYRNLCNGNYHVVIGHTGTNVMDLHYIVIP